MNGAELIAAERQRQIDQEGWTPEHDSQHRGHALALAGVCYALPVRYRSTLVWGEELLDKLWPWQHRWWKPTPDDRVRELVKAGALIAAEIDRIQGEVEYGED